MIQDDKVIVCDIDGTICAVKRADQSYADVEPRHDVLKKLRAYRARGFHIILHTSRSMRTYQGNVGLINANTAKVLLEWLAAHEVPYDELHFGKPWAGRRGFYVDDRAIRPDEFLKLTEEEIARMLGHE